MFAGLAHANCTDCHRDPHAGALGPRCTECHTTAGWKQVLGKGFDHDRTRYPLRGRHATVGCAKCHQEKGPKPAFARCTDCHRDEHGGKARRRPGWLACERCHTVDGFRPSRFALADHDTTAYPLQGAHRAVPCGLCHAAAAAKAPAAAAAAKVDLAPPAGRLHRLPHRPARARQEGGRRDARRLHRLPRPGELARRHLRSRGHDVPPGGAPRRRGLRQVPSGPRRGGEPRPRPTAASPPPAPAATAIPTRGP